MMSGRALPFGRSFIEHQAAPPPVVVGKAASSLLKDMLAIE